MSRKAKDILLIAIIALLLSLQLHPPISQLHCVASASAYRLFYTAARPGIHSPFQVARHALYLSLGRDRSDLCTSKDETNKTV